MSVLIACSWCGVINAVEIGAANVCGRCSHRPDGARRWCDCPACAQDMPSNAHRWREQGRQGARDTSAEEPPF